MPCMVYIYLHLVDFYGKCIEKISNRPMDASWAINLKKPSFKGLELLLRNAPFSCDMGKHSEKGEFFWSKWNNIFHLHLDFV